MNVNIVIDPLFGDGGKGMVTNWLANGEFPGDPIVIRFTGGHQAGHTVVTREGAKHIHSSYPSGTISGKPGYITEHCLVYPTGMRNEHEVLGLDPVLYVHPQTIVTMPYDISIGQYHERRLEHGSCGVGIGATMTRHYLSGRNKLVVADLQNEFVLRHKLAGIATETALKGRHNPILNDQLESFIEDVQWFLNHVTIADYSVLLKYRNLIFEGAQGVLLDKDHGMFPNVTFGNTTAKNAMDILVGLGLGAHVRETYYVARCYQTRHGNGPMSDERDLPLINNIEEINVLNDWQGQFRTGLFDPSLLLHGVRIDQVYNKPSLVYRSNLVLTCIDQLEEYPFVGSEENVELENLIESVSSNFKRVYLSDNPYSEVSQWK